MPQIALALALGLVACGPIYPPAPAPAPTPQPTQQPPTTPPPTEPVQPPEARTATPPTSSPVPLVSTTKPRPTSGSSQAEIAARKHWEGEEAYRRGQYSDASSSFREAVARVPEARYFYNLCASLFMEGKFSEALTSCDAVQRNNPPRDLEGKAAGLTVRIQDEARTQGLTIAPP